ncbi:hypothetical protein LOTGIDRAFT_152558 [Lottia gigantea]|uniref:Uncharacterized protein n=1 Tax=Lottia gigantea TaxID=225164 RepID=V4BD09_LOTGI|nr:hypothetical protein LOTGIDRAFT_152558 [Lottia gigantea]ESP05691.1 hypothetical protein LOTGIDRAFT_152558 [Lottia gigantea]
MTDNLTKEPNVLDADASKPVISIDKLEKSSLESKIRTDARQEIAEKDKKNADINPQNGENIDKNLKTCENPEAILQDIEDWNMDCQQLMKENKRIKAGLKMLLDEREKLLTENANLSEGVEKFHGQIQDLHVLLSRVDELEAENKDLKNAADKLQTEAENIRQEIIRKDQEHMEKLQFLKESHKDELKNLTDQMTATADYEKNILQEKISKNEKEILGLQMEKSQLQAQKVTELSDLKNEKLQHMKDEYEKEIKGLKRTIEDYQIGSRPSPRSRERLTLTTVGGKKRKS